MKSTLLGTGLDGLVGSRFAELFSNNYQITNLSLQTGVNITDAAAVDEAFAKNKADTVIHAAAFTDVGQAFAQTGDKNGLAYQVNVIGTENIARACTKNNKHLILISTDYVFDGKKNTPYTEEDEPKPLEWYGETKYQAELAAKKMLDSLTICRIAFPYRASFQTKPDLLAKTLAGLKEGTLYPQFSDTKITPTFIDDIAAVWNIMIKQKPAGTYHVVGSNSVSNYEFACQVAESYGFDPQTIKQGSLAEYLKSNPGRPFHQNLAISNEKLKTELDYQMTGLKEAFAIIKQQSKTSI